MPRGLLLPSPPSDREKWAYFGSQRRWVLLVMGLASVFFVSSLVSFAVTDKTFLPFLVPAVMSALTALISLKSSTGRRRVHRKEHEHRITAWQPRQCPSIDIFLPSAGEDVQILANTFFHVSRLESPASAIGRLRGGGKVRVYVLDDAGSTEVEHLALQYGFTYLSRPNRGELKKAGNLKFGYAHSDGDLIVVFDADFVPRTDFLRELLPYFDDSGVGIVQSPQYFEATRRQNWLQRSAGTTQELFYRWIQPGRDAVNAAICVGTNAIYRRAALAAAGGFAQIGHSEDVHTGVNLQKAGYSVRYVPVNLAKGICPDDMRGFVNQQYRWCAGSMSLMRDRTFHAHPLSLGQRICYWSGFGYYISTAIGVLLGPMPMLTMLWLHPDRIQPGHYKFVLAALAVSLVTLPFVHDAPWEPEVFRVQTVYAYAHLLAVMHAVRGRHNDWVPTGASGRQRSSTARTVSRFMRGWIAATQLLLWLGLFHGIVAHGFAHYWAAVLLAGFSAYINIPLLLPRYGLDLHTQARLAPWRGRHQEIVGKRRAGVTHVEPQPAAAILPAPILVQAS
jgi:cellulose synthase (UDP-forming)